MRTHTTPKARRFQRGGGISGGALIVLLHLLVLPAFALMQVISWIDWRLLAGGLILLSLITFLAYRADKRRAENDEWRIPESTLHFAEMIGALAPRHCLISAPLRDSNFRWQSVDRIAAAARPVYALLGAADALRVEHPDSDHDFPMAIRQEAYALLEKHL